MISTQPPVLVACGTLIPLTGLLAAGPASKSFGGFVAGWQFTLTVTKRESLQTRGTHVTPNAPIPSGFPKFKKGDHVTFSIGKNGRLKGPGFSIAFEKAKTQVNIHSNNPHNNPTSAEAGSALKSANGEPNGATPTFHKFHFSGFTPVTHSGSHVPD